MNNILNVIFQFFNYHMEEIIAINAFWLIGITVAYTAGKLRDVNAQEVFKGTLNYFLVAGQIFLFILLVCVAFVNFRIKEPLDFSAVVKPSTEWVDEDLIVFFISENSLFSIHANGSNRTEVFKAQENIREYHFSPNNKYILIVSSKKLYLYDQYDQESMVVANLDLPQNDDSELSNKGVINGVQWAPGSNRICYRVSRWSQYSSQDKWFVYDLLMEEKFPIDQKSLKIGSLNWDMEGQNLYYAWFNALDTSVHGNPYEVKIYRISLDTLFPEVILRFPFNEKFLPIENLSLRGIHLFSADNLSFGHASSRQFSWSSSGESYFGVDKEDHLYYIRDHWVRRQFVNLLNYIVEHKFTKKFRKNLVSTLKLNHLLTAPSAKKQGLTWIPDTGQIVDIFENKTANIIMNSWWRKRLYRIPRVKTEDPDIERYQYKGGRLVIQYIRWLPSGRYVIMEHDFFGILIMEPSSGKAGILVNEKGDTYGWYPQ